MSFFSVAIEQHEGDTTEEIEYGQFLKLSREQLMAVVEMARGYRRETFSESKIPTDGTGFTRMRHYPSADGDTFELTTKEPNGKEKSKDETNDTINEVNYRSLNTLASSVVLRTRVFIPILKDGQPIIKKNGKPLEWELDMYVDSRDYAPGTINIHPWVKLELEVDKATLTDVVRFIPFEYDEIIMSDTQDDADRAHIANLYNKEYNVRGKASVDVTRSVAGM